MSNTTDWSQGWWASARPAPSPNYGPRPPDVQVNMAVIHSISLPPGVYGGPEIEQLFTNCLDWQAHPYFTTIEGLEVSAHFLIRRTGEVVQFVSILDRAWHAGASTWLGRDNCNDYSIGIELEGLEGEHFDAPQYTALANLLHALHTHVGLVHVAGHEHVSPGRKCDPGAGFDWSYLQKLLANLPLTWP